MAEYKTFDAAVLQIETDFKEAGLEITLSRLSPESKGIRAAFSGRVALGALKDVRNGTFSFDNGINISGLGVTPEAAIRDLANEFSSATAKGQCVVKDEWRQEIFISEIIGMNDAQKPACLGWGTTNDGVVRHFRPLA